MIKRGYTLTEVLVAIGIVGVLAAVMMPLVSKVKPNTNKILYFDFLQEILILNDYFL